MARKTKRLRIAPTLKQQLERSESLRDSYHSRNQVVEAELVQYKRRLDEMRIDNDELKRQIQWHKQLNQNMSEAVCAYMRGRA